MLFDPTHIDRIQKNMSEGTELATNVSAVFDEQFTEEKVEQEVRREV